MSGDSAGSVESVEDRLARMQAELDAVSVELKGGEAPAVGDEPAEGAAALLARMQAELDAVKARLAGDTSPASAAVEEEQEEDGAAEEVAEEVEEIVGADAVDAPAPTQPADIGLESTATALTPGEATKKLESAFLSQRAEAIALHERGSWGMAYVAAQRALLMRPADDELKAIAAECDDKRGMISWFRRHRQGLAMTLMFLSVAMFTVCAYLLMRIDADRRTRNQLDAPKKGVEDKEGLAPAQPKGKVEQALDQADKALEAGKKAAKDLEGGLRKGQSPKK